MAISTCSAAGDASAGVQKPEADVTMYRVAGPRSQSRLCVLASATAALPYIQEVLTRAFIEHPGSTLSSKVHTST